MIEGQPTFTRRSGLGGSDVAAVLGVSPFKTAFDVYAEKAGLRAPDPETAAMRLGKLMEPVLARAYEEDTGRAVRLTGHAYEDPPLWHPNGVVFGHLDGEVDDGIWEGKTARHDADWTAGVPIYYEVQARVYLAITKAPWCDVTVLFRETAEFRHLRLEADPEFDEAICANADAWWMRHMVMGEPLEVDGSASATAYVADRWPRHIDLAVAANETAEVLAADLIAALDAKAQAETNETALKNRLRMVMGEAERMQGNGWNVLWRTGKDRRETNWQMVADAFRKAAANVLTAEEADAIVSLYTVEKSGTRPFLFRVERG